MSKQPRRIGLMLHLQWPYKRHTGIFAGTQQYAEEQGWNCIVDEFAHDALFGRSAKSVPYDGIIARVNQPLAKQAKRLKLPLVNVWGSSPVYGKVFGVYPDFAQAGQMCAEHLLARGFRNFATLVPSKSLPQELIVREFIRLADDAGFPCARVIVPQDPWRDVSHWRQTEQAIERCLDVWQTPIGVYVAHDEVGRLLVQACHRRGWRVPIDVAVIAGQNEEAICERPRPSLTSIELGYERVGYEAARQLHRLMDGKPPRKTPLLIPPQSLVVRESTDFVAVDNDLVAAALAFISANSHRSIGQNDVAKAVGAEPRTLQNRFRKHLGRPIVTEIRRVRIERAKRELAQSKRPMSDIARDVGFGPAMRMYEVFRRELGITPSEYRKQRQVEDAR